MCQPFFFYPLSDWRNLLDGTTFANLLTRVKFA